MGSILYIPDLGAEPDSNPRDTQDQKTVCWLSFYILPFLKIIPQMSLRIIKSYLSNIFNFTTNPQRERKHKTHTWTVTVLKRKMIKYRGKRVVSWTGSQAPAAVPRPRPESYGWLSGPALHPAWVSGGMSEAPAENSGPQNLPVHSVGCW